MKMIGALGIVLCCCAALRPALVGAQTDTIAVCRRLAAGSVNPAARAPAVGVGDTSGDGVAAVHSNWCHALMVRAAEAMADDNWYRLLEAADQLVDLKEADSAVAMVERHAAQHPHDTKTFEVLGALYQTLKAYRRAHCAYVRGLATDSASLPLWSGLALTAMQADHAREALGYWAHVERAHPGYISNVLEQPDFDAVPGPLDMDDVEKERDLYLEATAKERHRVPPRSTSSVLHDLPECLGPAGK